MRRAKLLLLTVAFVIAVGLNWPVAWFFSFNEPAPGGMSPITSPEMRRIWNELVPDGQRDQVLSLAGATDFFSYTRVRIQGGDVEPNGLQDARVRNLKVEWSGFPFRSVWCYRWWDASANVNELAGGIAIKPRQMSPPNGSYGWIDSLPYTPIWRGLVFNSVLYFLLLVTPIIVLPYVSRWLASLATEPGRCPRCDYDLRESPDGCPECGWRRTRLSSLD